MDEKRGRDEEKSGAYRGTRTRYDPRVIQDRGSRVESEANVFKG